MKAAAFSAWLRRAARGDRVVYHVGLLMKDRQPPLGWQELLNADWEPVESANAVGKAAREAHANGAVELFQRRLNEFSCEYIAVRR